MYLGGYIVKRYREKVLNLAHLRPCTQLGTLVGMGTSKGLEPGDKAAAELLQELVTESGKSYRAIRDETGISINRIGKILRQEPPPASLGEVGLIARALGSSATEVVTRSERMSQDGYTLAASDHDYEEEMLAQNEES